MSIMMNTTQTKHSEGCKKAFNRLDADCPRCRELLAGAPARRGWGPPVRSLQHGTVAAARPMFRISGVWS